MGVYAKKTLHPMSSVPVEVTVYNTYPPQEFKIDLLGETTLGNLRDVIHALLGGDSPMDSAWVAFADERTSFIPFNQPDQGHDGLQIKFLRCSSRVDSYVSVGVFRYSVPVERPPEAEVQENGAGNKRAAEEEVPFTRLTLPRV